MNFISSIPRASVRNISTMNWEIEKAKFLSLDLNDKRRLYLNKKYRMLDDVPTWKEYYLQKQGRISEPESSEDLFDIQIDPKFNSILCGKVSLFQGDITTLEVDAIVNAANKTLLGGGGVDGAIHRAAGPLLKEECRSLNGCEEADAKISCGYKLPAKYVIHTVGPHGEQPELLNQCYKNCLHILHAKSLRTIAIPCISTGLFGYPCRPAAHVALSTTRKYLEKYSDDVDRVIFCVFLSTDQEIYEILLQKYFPIH